jgi:hypothetical protein
MDMAIYYNPKIDTNGLVFFLDAANLKSYPKTGTTWNNAVTINNVKATLTNGPTFSSSNGGYISFDGTDDYAVTDTSLYNPTAFKDLTLILWYYPISSGQIVSELGQPIINASWHAGNIEQDTNGKFYFSLWHGSLTNRVTSIKNVGFNIWVQVCLTYRDSATLLTGYVNGSSQGTASLTRQTTTSSYYALCANDSTNMIGTTDYPQGRVGMFMVYNKVLTDFEIETNYNTFKDRYGLV